MRLARLCRSGGTRIDDVPAAIDGRRPRARRRRSDRGHLLVVDVPRARRPHGPRPGRGRRPRVERDLIEHERPGTRPNGGNPMNHVDVRGPRTGHVEARPVALPALGDARLPPARLDHDDRGVPRRLRRVGRASRRWRCASSTARCTGGWCRSSAPTAPLPRRRGRCSGWPHGCTRRFVVASGWPAARSPSARTSTSSTAGTAASARRGSSATLPSRPSTRALDDDCLADHLLGGRRPLRAGLDPPPPAPRQRPRPDRRPARPRHVRGDSTRSHCSVCCTAHPRRRAKDAATASGSPRRCAPRHRSGDGHVASTTSAATRRPARRSTPTSSCSAGGW